MTQKAPWLKALISYAIDLNFCIDSEGCTCCGSCHFLLAVFQRAALELGIEGPRGRIDTGDEMSPEEWEELWNDTSGGHPRYWLESLDPHRRSQICATLTLAVREAYPEVTTERERYSPEEREAVWLVKRWSRD